VLANKVGSEKRREGRAAYSFRHARNPERIRKFSIVDFGDALGSFINSTNNDRWFLVQMYRGFPSTPGVNRCTLCRKVPSAG
jgi:hypothetical protein